MEKDQNGQLYEPSSALKGIVSHFYHVFNNPDAAPVIKHVSPSLEMELIFNFGPPVKISYNQDAPGTLIIERISIIGPLKKMLNYKLPANADAIVITFELDGFYRLFKVPLTDVTGNENYNLSVLPRQHYLEELWRALKDLEDIKDRLQMLNHFIAALAVTTEDAVKPLLDGEDYFHNPLIQPVKAIAADTGLTERSIQMRFQKYAGYSPKELLRFLRFKAVINHLLNLRDDKPDIFDMINKFNYHDQSHLIKDFNYFLGTTPHRFIKELKGRQFYLTGQDKNRS